MQKAGAVEYYSQQLTQVRMSCNFEIAFFKRKLWQETFMKKIVFGESDRLRRSVFEISEGSA